MKITGIIISFFLLTNLIWAEHDQEIGRLYLKEGAFSL